MSETTRFRLPALTATSAPLRRPARAALVAVLSSWVPLALLTVVGWAGSARTTVGWGDALGVASLAWVTAHLGALRAGETTLALSPLLLTLLPLAACAAAGRSLSGPVQDDRSPRIPRLGGMRQGVVALVGCFVLTYAALGLVVAAHAATMPVSPVWPVTVGGCLLVPMVGGAVGLRHELVSPELAPVWHDKAGQLLPVPVRRALSAGVRGVGVLLLVGLLPAAVALVWHLGRVRDLTGELDAGPLGTVVLALAQLAWLPNVAAWGLSWVAGPGFTVGLGSAYTWQESRSGLLPMVPVLGALPDNGTLPSWVMAAGVLPVVVGALTTWWAVNRVSVLASLAGKALAALGAWVVLVLGTAVVLWTSGGSLGAKALAEIGPRVLPTTAAVAGETALGGLLMLALVWRRYHR
ncbi:DUF6350 family protein [Arsenicicoccus dermatophilus]|uniref:cell division protein PerM n=1 Tax=Arsenicicoccus dermatophilus TaxID=1076331 RepID=UPI001F4C7525|nr:DUF6350 family protein [Arsenicicoccus dermatophilus]MCH8612233.1 DUF6350 family protein [Arsenicicoccus dermatophilus]